ncbi:hypothetical protein GBA65_07245 [Rubrobacter marinus]|uniref:Uncharacterized protein n=1 Tax=Rubrobacter marinus TaxID=2653852 RepID=A0A6G8PVW8_9ACTN|nr:hypothetical protein [Rubrobacter marinus]QIN78348.1 hypothetical protein GBA65_07245 [Rubrobacter marinus]
MTEYTATSVRALIEGLEPLKVDAPGEEALSGATEYLEELEGLIGSLPAAERCAAISDVALESGHALWVPIARNCRLSAGVAVEDGGLLSFAVGDESAGGALTAHFSARSAAAHALFGGKSRVREAESKDDPLGSDPFPEDERDEGLVEALKAAGWAVPTARLVDDLAPELLAWVAGLSERGVAHLFAEGDGVVLAMAGSTAGDRKKAAERLPASPTHRTNFRRAFGVLTDAGDAGSHYSEEEGWGLTARAGKGSPDRELEVAAELFRASRAGSLAVAGTKAERRRIEANRKRMRSECAARRRRGEELAVRPAREIDAGRREAHEPHWTEDSELGRRTERARRSGRASYDTARAVYLQGLPTPAHRLLHLLRREGGAVREEEFLSRRARLAGPTAVNPEASLRAALSELAEAGKVRRLRSRRTSEVFLAATEGLDETSFRRSLNGLIRDERFGIVSPGSKPTAWSRKARRARRSCSTETSTTSSRGDRPRGPARRSRR